jgi:ATP-binding cassette subfamily B (MDR/TAP) protein 1
VNEIDARHERAVAEGRDTYVDPETGYEVFTAAYLTRRGVCCGSGCRHCPFDHVNVEPAERPASRIVSLLRDVVRRFR